MTSALRSCIILPQMNIFNMVVFFFCFFPQGNNNYEVLYIVVDNSLIQVYPPKKK